MIRLNSRKVEQMHKFLKSVRVPILFVLLIVAPACERTGGNQEAEQMAQQKWRLVHASESPGHVEVTLNSGALRYTLRVDRHHSYFRRYQDLARSPLNSVVEFEYHKEGFNREREHMPSLNDQVEYYLVPVFVNPGIPPPAATLQTSAAEFFVKN